MKKIVLILMLGVFTFGNSGFKNLDSHNNNGQIDLAGASCFDFARASVEERDGGINLDNINDVNFLTFVCEFYSLDDSIVYP